MNRGLETYMTVEADSFASGDDEIAREQVRVEVKHLLETVFQRYGFDFREYAEASLERRILGVVESEKLNSISELRERVVQDDPEFLDRFLRGLTVNVTGMFRDPEFFLAFRRHVVPLLRTYPFVRIWHAGCSTGEEVYSMAILLHEEGIYPTCRIYATDLNQAALRDAKDGVVPLCALREYSENYRKAGGTGSLAEYYTAAYDRAIFRSSFKERIVFSQHNLVTDASFNEFNVILCRNVLIYFKRPLRDRVHQLIYGSLCKLGVLCLGNQETMRLTPNERYYEAIDLDQRLYRRVG